MCSLDLERPREKARETPEEQGFNEIDIRKEAVGMLLRTTRSTGKYTIVLKPEWMG